MSADDIDDSSAPLIEHLTELRNRIMYLARGLCRGHVVWLYRLEPDLQLSDPTDLRRTCRIAARIAGWC